MIFHTDVAKYVGGIVSHFEFKDVDKMSMVVLNGMLTKDLGNSNGGIYYMDAT